MSWPLTPPSEEEIKIRYDEREEGTSDDDRFSGK